MKSIAQVILAFLFAFGLAGLCFYRSVPELLKWWQSDSCVDITAEVTKSKFQRGSRKNAAGSMERTRSGSVEVEFKYLVKGVELLGTNYMREPRFDSKREAEGALAQFAPGKQVEVCYLDSYPSISWVRGTKLSFGKLCLMFFLLFCGGLLALVAIAGAPMWLREELSLRASSE